MACIAPDVSLAEAIWTSIVFTTIYVGVLYLPFNNGNRNSTSTIFSRVVTLTAIAVAIELYTRHRIPDVHYRMSHGTRLPALIVSSVLTLMLYSGHLAVTPVANLNTYSFYDEQLRFIAIRNYILGPLLEEIVFRRQTLLIWACQPTELRLLFPAAMFSLAHIHHVRALGVVGILFQMTYTFLFGVYAAALYINLGTVWAPFIAHVICNVLELPDFASIAVHPYRRPVIALYTFTVALFAVAFGPLTTLVQPYELAYE